MHRILFRAFLLAATVAFAPVLRSAYNPAIVSADARWVVYLDLNALRGSTLGQELIAAVESAQKQATDVAVGIDVSKLLATIGTVTAYGTNISPDPKLIDGALIAQGTADLRKIIESVLLQGTLAQPKVFTEVSDLPFPAYAISDPQAKEEDKTQLVVAFPPEPIVLVSKSKKQLLKARDVFRGSAASLAKANSPLAKARGDGAYVFSAMLVPEESPFPKNAPQARILQLTQSGSLAIGERGSDTFAHAELVASSDANADRLMKILQGLTAMLGLAEATDKQLGDFLRSASVTRDKTNVTLDLAYSSARLAQMVKTMRLQAEAPAAKKRPPTIMMGRSVAEWSSAEAPADSTGGGFCHTIQSVELVNGSMITLGRTSSGRTARFVSLEIAADGGGTPLTIKPEFMRSRGSMWQYPFPGAPGQYTLKINYAADPDEKARFAVSIMDPKPAEEPRGK